MKHSLKSLYVAAAAIAVASSASAAVVDFSGSASDLALFNQYTNTGATSTSFAFSSTSGVGGGEGLLRSATPDTTLIYKTSAVDFSGAAGTTSTISMMVKSTNIEGTGGSSNAFQLGFTESDTQGFYGNTGYDFVSLRNNFGVLQTQTRDNSIGTPLVSTALTPDPAFSGSNWYKFTLTLTKSATLNTFDFAAVIDDYGTNGTSLVGNVASHTGTFSNSSLYGDSTVYAGFRVSSSAANVDNFSVIPESSVALLGGFGALALLRRRRN